MGESFTDYQRWMWRTLSILGMFRYYVDISPKTKRYYVKNVTFLNLAWFWLIWGNTIFKFIYHVLTYHSLLGIKVHFLDQMSMWDWFLMEVHCTLECSVWFFKYPFWENIYRQWELQEVIYRKLGRPSRVAKKIIHTDRINFYLYGGICLIGTLALAIQNFWTPKYALNTYAIVPAENFLLTCFFCFHECVFMCSAYSYQAYTMVVAESYAVSYQHLLEEMNKVMKTLIIRGQVANKSLLNKKVSLAKTGSEPAIGLDFINPHEKVEGTDYNILGLVEDYRKIMISGQFHNQWIGAIMGYPTLLNYAQFVSDVFMMIQLLKEEGDIDLFGVAFYIMDAIFGMIMIFRMLIILSRLVPQSERFLKGLKTYASPNTPLRKELFKVLPSLRNITAQLTGKKVRPETVPLGIHVLINWYICAAMWQRPADRRT